MAEPNPKSTQKRPRLAVVVANAITGDSRVQKTALSAAYDGWDVLLIGRSTSARVERTWMGPVKVLRVPVDDALRRQENFRRRNTVTRKTVRAGLISNKDAAWAEARHQTRARDRDARMAEVGALHRLGLRVAGRAGRDWLQLRLRAQAWGEGHLPNPDRAVGDWRHDTPVVLDLDRAIGPAIEEFRPDVIHANDITGMYPAAIAASRLRRQGHEVHWLYDAHEYVSQIEWPTERIQSGYPQVEREFIGQADAVVTVSDEIADILRADHRLTKQPLVVLNTPLQAAVGTAPELSVRAVVELDDDVPLLVYSGYVQANRGLETALGALPELPGVHLAVVTNRDNPATRELLSRAQELGVGDRVHLAPYVAQHEVPDYLSSADLGVIVLDRTPNHEISLPTKLAEYLHADLPVVVSDVRTLSAFVREHGVGEVCTAGEPVTFAAAVRTLLADRDRYLARITDDLKKELSWEFQAAGLLKLYRDISGLVPPPADIQPSWDLTERFRHVASDKNRNQLATPEDGHPWRRLTKDTPIRLGLAPANYAGQLAALATSVTEHREDVSAEVTMHTSGQSFGYPADVYAANSTLKHLDVQIAHLQRTLPRYTHLIADAFRPVFGTLNGDDISGDLPALRHAKIKVALLAHGSEIRSPARHRERSPHSHFHDVPEQEIFDVLTRLSDRNLAIVDSVDLPVYVTTPDLLDDVPRATWLPLVVDIDSWATSNPIMERARPVVLHAPSRRWTKGTDRFLPALEEMERKGLIELNLVEGLLWPEMQRQVKEADIVIDQVAVGAYGAFACEAMAAGKPVISYLTDHVVATVGDDLPIVNATGAEVADAIEQLVADRDATREIGAASARFARAVHDGRRAAEILDGFLR
ncbi:glycosyltransferase [Pimelobacter simplex]|uniref:Glycosyltransferase subfamily 4-like N-terminal domain-containing protein n=1 Tax=Nocardioides simplex TaxID=2045 RepID=A0A0A1DFM8_NOCSI|nr:glycosyltransferase [Pimelobacter simplex]AIY16034.1 hypothetical protein KR76_03350 [Pimelobacter simplex]MCG8151038.1 glycosyltransferase [Pimelobacter simplex]GEB12330.1 hypothetical protein NSI01_06450 [Pimelobacter simplex]SFM96458.1 Glycosyltransferase involved in cell wall bisynthesis [Pimelobacter simplex]